MRFNYPPRFNARQVLSCDSEDDAVIYSSTIQDQVWQTQLQNRQIIINGLIDDSLIEKAVIQIFNINDFDSIQENEYKEYTRYPISVMINSAGGNGDEALSLVSAILSSVTPVNTVALGKAWSAGFLILLAGHNRYCQKFSSMMLHQGSAGIMDTFSKMVEYIEYWKSYQKSIDEYILSRTKITKKQIEQNFCQKQDWYITASEAVALGIVDDII